MDAKDQKIPEESTRQDSVPPDAPPVDTGTGGTGGVPPEASQQQAPAATGGDGSASDGGDVSQQPPPADADSASADQPFVKDFDDLLDRIQSESGAAPEGRDNLKYQLANMLNAARSDSPTMVILISRKLEHEGTLGEQDQNLLDIVKKVTTTLSEHRQRGEPIRPSLLLGLAGLEDGDLRNIAARGLTAETVMNLLTAIMDTVMEPRAQFSRIFEVLPKMISMMKDVKVGDDESLPQLIKRLYSEALKTLPIDTSLFGTALRSSDDSPNDVTTGAYDDVNKAAQPSTQQSKNEKTTIIPLNKSWI